MPFDKDTLVMIGIGAALLAVLGLIFLLLPKCEPPLPPSSGYYYGLAEASGPDAESRAVNEARAKMVEMANVEVVVESVLEKNAVALCGRRECEKSELEKFKREVKTRAQMELSDYTLVTKRCGDKVYALAYISKAKADMYFKSLSLRAILDSAVESGMIFTAERILKELKSYEPFFKKPPSFFEDLPKIESELSKKLTKAKVLISKIEGIGGSAPENALKALSLYRSLLSITPEIPTDVTERVKELLNKSGVSISLSGPSEVVRSQIVRLVVELPRVSGSYRLDVEVSGGKFPSEVTVEGGRGVIEGRVEGDVSVAVKLTDFLKAEWSPGSVLDPTLQNSLKVLMSSTRAPEKSVIFLPSSLKPEDVAASIDAEKAASLLGWKFVSHDHLSKEYEKLVSNWLQSWKVEKIPAVFIEVGENGLKFEGAVDGYLKASVVSRRASEEEIRKVLKAAVASGNAEIALKTEGFIKGVALYSLGRLEEAAKVLESCDEPIAKIALSKVYYEMGDYKRAIEKAAEVIGEYPNQSLTLIAMSLVNLPPEIIFLHPEYQDYIFGAVHKVRNNHAAYYAASVLLRKLGNCEEAKEWIVKALDFSGSPEYMIEYARVLECLGRKDEARSVLKDLLSVKNLRFSIRKEAEEMLEELEK